MTVSFHEYAFRLIPLLSIITFTNDKDKLLINIYFNDNKYILFETMFDWSN